MFTLIFIAFLLNIPVFFGTWAFLLMILPITLFVVPLLGALLAPLGI